MYFAFDFDGTIANSELLKMEAYIAAVGDVSDCVPNIVPSELTSLIGLPETEVAGRVLERISAEKTKPAIREVVLRKREIYDGFVKASGVSLFDDVMDLAEELVEKGGRCAIVTGSHSHQVKKIISAKGRGLSTFEFIIGKENVTRPKPDSEGYEIFLKRFGVSEEQACAVEDSPQGARAALNAGIQTLMPKRDYNMDFEAPNITKCLSGKALKKAALQHLYSHSVPPKKPEGDE